MLLDIKLKRFLFFLTLIISTLINIYITKELKKLNINLNIKREKSEKSLTNTNSEKTEKNEKISANNNNENFDQEKYNIIGTYSIGSGFSVLAKKKIIDEIRKKLIDNYFYDGNDINNKLINLKIKGNLDFYKIENLNINTNEFNVYLIFKNKKILMGTSSHELKDFYYEYLAGEIGADKKNFFEKFVKKIDDEIKKIEKSEGKKSDSKNKDKNEAKKNDKNDAKKNDKDTIKK